MNIFSRSWKLTKASFKVIGQEKEILLYPIISGILSLGLIATLILPLIITYLATKSFSGAFATVNYFFIVLLYIGLAFITTFFSVCVVYTAAIRFSGKNANFGSTFKFAFSKIHIIFLWSLVSASIGLFFKILENLCERLSFVGNIILSIIRWILGLLWSIITLFVIPVIVYENVGPFKAISRSAQTLKKTWGEGIIGAVGMGATAFLFFMLGVIILIPLAIIVWPISSLLSVLFLGLLIVYIFLLFLIFNVAGSVFTTALYVYSQTGENVGEFDSQLLKDSIKVKKKKGELLSGIN
jgi:hypothetical protein